MKKTTLNTVEDSDNKRTVIANQNEKINDSARRISDADDDEYYFATDNYVVFNMGL